MIKELFILFVIFSLIGYFLEIFSILIESKYRRVAYSHPRFGPLPLSFPYGFGGVFSYLIITQFPNIDCITFALIVIIVFSLIEYISAIFCERTLRVKYWDYSYLRFNLKGRVCLRNSILFMLAGLISFTPIHSINGILQNTPTSLIDLCFIFSIACIFIECLYGEILLKKDHKQLKD